MASPTLDDLLSQPTQDEVLDQEVFPELARRKVRVTSWLAGGAYRAMAYVVSFMRVGIRKAIAAFVAACFEDYVFGFAAPPAGIDVTSWAPFLALQRYGVKQIGATFTKRRIRLTNSSNAVYNAVLKSRITVQFPSGYRYVLDEGVDIPASGYVDAVFRSERVTQPGFIYSSDPSDASPIVLVTANFPGVTATNPASSYTEVSQLGAGAGTLDLTNSPALPHTVQVRIDATGQSGAATWSTNLDGGGWVSQGNAGSITGLGSDNIDIALDDDGGGANPSFIAGTIYYFSTPGSDITQVGRDVETPQELGTRCRGLWPSLAFAKDPAGNWIPTSPTMSAYEALARSASDQVKVCLVETSGRVNNLVRVVVAGEGALLPGAVLTLLRQFFASFTMLTDRVEVSAPTERAIALAGGVSIYAKKAQLAAAQVELQRRLQLYLRGVDAAAPLAIGTDASPSLVDHAYLVALIRTTPGVTRTDADTLLTINTVVGDLQLPVTPGQDELATWAQLAASIFTWVPV